MAIPQTVGRTIRQHLPEVPDFDLLRLIGRGISARCGWPPIGRRAGCGP